MTYYYICAIIFHPVAAEKMFVNKSVFDLVAHDMYSFQNEYGDRCHVFIYGDFNARVGERADYVENESLIYFDIMPDGYVEDNDLSRPRGGCRSVFM